MGAAVSEKFVMVSNRGPNFTTPGKKHTAMGGTKGIYPQLMETFCDSWVCLSPEELNTGKINSEYGDKLDILFIDPEMYHQYYYSYVSEKLYPYLLGYSSLSRKHSRTSFDVVMEKLVTKLSDNHPKKNVIICDYHLYSLPKRLPKDISKIFFWFIPILTIDKYDQTIIEVLEGLNAATEVYFFDEVWAQNFVNLFYHFLPDQELQVKVRSLMMGPDEFYGQTTTSGRNDYDKLLRKNFGESPNGRHIVSVSRMDFVKRLPLLIEGFERYIDATTNLDVKLLLFAPHHRQDSRVYAQEHQTIKDMVYSSKYKEQIFLTHNHLESDSLRTIFTYADMFVCPSKHDAMPLTPLEYILSNDGNGSLVVSDSLGAYRLLRNFSKPFEPDDASSLAKAIEEVLCSPQAERRAKMQVMKQVVTHSTIQKAIIKLANDWK